MGTPIFKLVFDRKKRATTHKEGTIELRITYDRLQRFISTGVRVLPKQWRYDRVVNRLDAVELQTTLDMFVTDARKIVNDLIRSGEFDIHTIVPVLGEKMRQQVSANVPSQRLLLPFFKERSVIRKYGRSADSQERYDRFLRWFERWGVMVTFDDITEVNIVKMDEALASRGMKRCSIWGNYHRFLNSFILDAINEGIMTKNPYNSLHIDKAKKSHGLEKYLTRDEFNDIAGINPTTNFLRHARDLFIFQTYTCLSYVDLAAFDSSRIREVNGQPMYYGYRGKTKQQYTFAILPPAMNVLNAYDGQLPMMSNQKYNDRLKILAMMAGINKPVSSHWARHTGATLLLNSGVDIEIVAKILGHSSTRITREVYAKLLDETIADAMKKITL